MGSKNLLFIGGVADGRWQAVPQYQDAVIVRWLNQNRKNFYQQPSPPESVPIHAEGYTRRKLVVADRPFEFIAKSNLTDADAMEMLMAGYKIYQREGER